MKNKTYKNFGDAFLELKENFPTISYGKIARELDITDSYAWNLPNRRRKSPIPKKMLVQLAGVFKVKPSYFYEFRLYEMLDFINDNRRFLDHCLRQAKKYKTALETGKDIIREEEFKEEFEELEEESIKKSAGNQ
ncbi:MAG: hypothetical protein A2Z35_04905 [Actinobacteria bacterium RBG_19FT_COMBO_36_27]|nr:MAG: hypothetical protein A2Z35_04905 [Actinobacteria bacterium RBG_19FT_COMBO_36_27]